jgi:hypothetical protein
MHHQIWRQSHTLDSGLWVGLLVKANFEGKKTVLFTAYGEKNP